MTHRIPSLAALASSLALWASASASDQQAAGLNWPEFRGPNGDGTAAGRHRGLPTVWSEDKNVAWKTPIPHSGWSTPLIWKDQIWLTASKEDGTENHAICVDRKTGKILHQQLLWTNEAVEPLGNNVNGYASPTGVIEEGRVYLSFGTYGTVCIDTRTYQKVWERRDIHCRHLRGPGSSLVAWKDTIIATMDGADVQYLIALRKDNGKNVWKTERSTKWTDLKPDGSVIAEGDGRKAYSTPLFCKVGDRVHMVSCGAKAAFGYDPGSGEELWTITYKGFSNASRPVYWEEEQLVYINTGFGKADLLAVKLDEKARGDITGTHIKWTLTKRVPTRSSPVLAGDHLYMINEPGLISRVDAKTGEIIFTERVAGKFSGSPIYAGGHLYFCSEEGKSHVLDPEAKFKRPVPNVLDSGMMASPAVSGSALFLRTKTHLYRIENS